MAAIAGAPRNAKKAPGLAIRSANGASEDQSGGSFGSLVMVLHWQAPVARRTAATPTGCHCRVLTGTKLLDAGLTAAAAAWWMEMITTLSRRRCWEERRVSTPPVEKLRLKGCGGDGPMAAERATAAERMEVMGPVVIAGDVLGLGRVGSGSEWPQIMARCRRSTCAT